MPLAIPFSEPLTEEGLTFSEKKNVYQYQSLLLFLKRPCNREKMAGHMNLPFFTVEEYVQNQAEKTSKNAFRPVPVPKSTFSEKKGFTESLASFDALGGVLENSSFPQGSGTRSTATQIGGVFAVLFEK